LPCYAHFGLWLPMIRALRAPFQKRGRPIPLATNNPQLEVDPQGWRPTICRTRRSRAILSAHIASTLLTCFILDCSIRIGEQNRRARPDKGTITKLTGLRREARGLQRVLDPCDATLERQFSSATTPQLGRICSDLDQCPIVSLEGRVWRKSSFHIASPKPSALLTSSD
jgi:hypothetical protein